MIKDYYPKITWSKPKWYLQNIRVIWSRITDFFERGCNGWAKGDVWDVDRYLGQVIPNMIEYYKKVNNGYPGSDQFPNEEKFDEALTKVIDGFRRYDSWEDEYFKLPLNEQPDYVETYYKEEADFKETMKLFTDLFGNLWL